MSIKGPETERLAAEVAALARETKTRAVKVGLRERRERLALKAARRDRRASLRRFLEHEVWPQVPEDVPGAPLGREDGETILGYGPDGA
ncbi:MAG TPA: type II toxin-antitoxin system VapB family antitoxin [Candidatus Dormibacteraeota bacterium]|nr:type II toxin-antitoxin system VapB family antitoxin [Candidatus Dormibacteraeota bacterium]